MRRDLLLRCAMIALACVHTFPCTKHLAAFVVAPSWGEAWKGLGAALAVTLYLLPPSLVARALVRAWHARRGALAVGGWVLAAVHVVPALDHVPRLIETGGWGDAWRGLGATLATIWFLLPVPTQARALGALRRVALVPLVAPRGGEESM